MNKKLVDAMNKQIMREWWSGHIYLAMEAHLADLGLSGMAHWMRTQYKEEEVHGFMIFGFLGQVNEKPVVLPMPEVPAKWDSVLAVWENVLAHEKQVTAWIHELVDIATEVGDKAAYNFLQWYVSEQVEEEDNAQQVIDTLKFVKSDPQSILLLDRELGQRTFVAPAEAATYGAV